MRGLMLLGILGGLGWYVYRKVMGSGSGTTNGTSLTDRLPSAVREKVAAAANKVETSMAASQSGVDREGSATGSPAETRAAAMAGAPAVQPPATVPEP